jgi:hypothetical protein
MHVTTREVASAILRETVRDGGSSRRRIGIEAGCFNPHRPVIAGDLGGLGGVGGLGTPGFTKSPDAEEPVGGTRRSR